MRNIALCLVMTLVVLALAQGAQARAQTALTPKSVEAFVASLEEMARLMGLEPGGGVGSGTSAPSATARFWLVEAGTALDAQRVLARRGFTETGWGETGYRVINAYVTLREGDQSSSGDLDEEFRQAVMEIENDASLTDEQRDEYIAYMRSSRDEAARSQAAPNGDLDAVRPFLARLDRIIAPDDPR